MKFLIFDVGGVLLINGQINQPLLNICLDLKQQNYSLAIISNYSSVPSELSNLSIFDPILSYDQTHLLKPDPRLFQKFIDITQAPLSDCLFVDDTLSHISASKNFGFSTIHYQSLAQFKKCLAQFLKNTR